MITAQQWLNVMTASRQQQIAHLQEEIEQLQNVCKTKLWQLSVDQVGLSARTSNALRRNAINIVADLMLADSNGILPNVPGIGEWGLCEIRSVLDDVMYTLHDKQSWLQAIEGNNAK